MKFSAYVKFKKEQKKENITKFLDNKFSYTIEVFNEKEMFLTIYEDNEFSLEDIKYEIEDYLNMNGIKNISNVYEKEIS